MGPIDAKFLSLIERDEAFPKSPATASGAPGGPRYSAPKAKNANISAKSQRIRRAPGSLEPSRRDGKNGTGLVVFGAGFAELLAENHRDRSKMAAADDVTAAGENRPYLGNARAQRAQIRVRRSRGGPCPKGRVAGPGDAPWRFAGRGDPRL